MKKTITIIGILLLLFLLLSCSKSGRSGESDTVYICTGASAYAYHSNSNCSGLNQCGATIKKVSVPDIKGRSPCKKCYK